MDESFPIEAGFLGPKAEHGKTWTEVFNYILQDYIYWRRNYFPEDEQILDRGTRRLHEAWFDILSNELDKVLNELKADYPFYSPRYHGHMISENLAPGVIGYFAGMLYNPNNVSSESAPITVNLELKVGRMIAAMLGYHPDRSWTHITSGGTIANLEALWAARQNMLNGVAFQHVCNQYSMPFEIWMPNGESIDIRKVNQKTLIRLSPDVQAELPALFTKAVQELDLPIGEIMKKVKYGPYSLTANGVNHVYQKLNIDPVILVSETAHYSIKKAANILGLGERNVISLPVDAHFRLRIDALRDTIGKLNPNQVVLAAIGVLGTTEVGAIDPIHKLVEVRNDEARHNRSFWIHVDAAWGGYLRTMEKQDPCLSVHVRKTLASLPDVDSITIDPHKMGFIPYPSGIISFKNKYAVLHSHQVAPYITLNHETPNPLDVAELTNSIGPYIIEGSKPGAAAVATWLTHKTIPLNPDGHGKIIKSTIENTQRFYKHILELAAGKRDQGLVLEPFGEPDCNVMCYYFKIFGNESLEAQNELNKRVYKECSLSDNGVKKEMPYRKEYFISHTHFFPSQYPYESVKHLLSDIPNSQRAYEQNGLFLLRSVIMNPWLSPARQKSTDHLTMLLDKLYKIAEEEFRKTNTQVRSTI